MNMPYNKIKSLTLSNYRGFTGTIISFRSFSLLVGKNSAGKSTVIEALRLLSLITLRLRKPSFERAPSWTDLEPGIKGMSISLADSEIDLKSISFLYEKAISSFMAKFEDGSEITGYLKEGELMFATFKAPDGYIVSDRRIMGNIVLPAVYVMPQVQPVQVGERLISEKHVEKNQLNPVSRLHFRNQIFYNPDLFDSFKLHAEESWPRLRIDQLLQDVDTLNLMVRDQEFTNEIGKMGSGLQVWLQMIWFLTKVKGNSILALDEPDVYLHADLQRKLIVKLKELNCQVIIASHSVEIMAETKPSEMVIIDRRKARSKFADSNIAVQKIIDENGGVHNIQLARLWGAKKCLFVEGKDMQLLREIVKKIAQKKYVTFTNMPNFQTNGWSGLAAAQGFAKTFVANSENSFEAFCILDRDYRPDDVVNSQVDKSAQSSLRLFVWKRKEIENYFLAPDVIYRVVATKLKRGHDLTIMDVNDIVNQACEAQYTDLIDKWSESILDSSVESKRQGVSSSNPMARQLVDANWNSLELKCSICCGKEAFTYISNKFHAQYSITISSLEVARAMRKDEVHSEMKEVLLEILR